MTTYSQTLEIVTGDTLPAMVFTLRDSNRAAAGMTLDENNESTWAPIDITDAVVRLRVRTIGSIELADTRTGTIVDGPAGTVSIEFASSTFEDPGTYEGELEITFPSGGIQTVVQLIKFKVREGFG